MPGDVHGRRTAPTVDRRRYASGRQNDEYAALFEGAARLCACGDIGLLRPPRPGKVQRNGVGTHLREITAAVQHDLEVPAHLTDEPAQQQSIDDAEGMIRDHHQRTAAGNVLEGPRLEVPSCPGEAHGIVPESRLAMPVCAVLIILFLQALLA